MIYPRYLKVGFSIDNKPMISFIAENEVNYKIYIDTESIKGFRPFQKVTFIRTEEKIYTGVKTYFPITDMFYPVKKKIEKENRASFSVELFKGIAFNTLIPDFEINSDYFILKDKCEYGILIRDISKKKYCKLIDNCGLGNLDVNLYSHINPFYTIGEIEDISLLKGKYVDIYFNRFENVLTQIEGLHDYYKDDCKEFYPCIIHGNKIIVIND